MWVCTAILVLLLCLGACLLWPSPRHLCPRTHEEARHVSTVRLGDRCFAVRTCTPQCARELQKLAEASEDAFRDKYQVRRVADGLALHHHVTQLPAQVAVEVPCHTCISGGEEWRL